MHPVQWTTQAQASRFETVGAFNAVQNTEANVKAMSVASHTASSKLQGSPKGTMALVAQTMPGQTCLQRIEQHCMPVEPPTQMLDWTADHGRYGRCVDSSLLRGAY